LLVLQGSAGMAALPSTAARHTPGPVPLTAGPTGEFRRHHEVEAPEISLAAFHPAWRVKTRLDRLFRDKLLSPAQWSAAVRYRETYERAHAGELGSILDSIGTGRAPQRSGQPHPTIGEGQRDAVRHLKQVRQALGPVTVNLLEACIVADMSWCALARRLHVDPKTAKHWTLSALKALGEAI
jgi:hypothetical protein